MNRQNKYPESSKRNISKRQKQNNKKTKTKNKKNQETQKSRHKIWRQSRKRYVDLLFKVIETQKSDSSLYVESVRCL